MRSPSRAPSRTTSRAPRACGQAGFSLVELLVGLFMFLLLLLGTLAVFDFSSRTARAQTEVAGMQQAQRVAQHELVRLARMTGRGGVRVGDALVIRNDTPAGTPIVAGGGSDVPEVAAGTDVVVVRGVFTNEIFQLDTNNSAAFVYGGGASGTVTIRGRSPSGVPQDVSQLEELAGDGGNTEPLAEAMMFVSAVDDSDYVVVEIDPGSINAWDDNSTVPATRVVQFTFRVDGGTNTDDYAVLSSSNLSQPVMRTVAYAGVLEEYRFYVRRRDAPAGEAGSGDELALARARVFPGTETPWRDEAGSLEMVIADGVADLQAALGWDSDGDGLIAEGTPDERNDEWLFNVSGDTAPTGALAFLRLTTVTRTNRPDPQYRSRPLGRIEDRDYADDDANTEIAERRYRRWPLQALIDLRNL
ncbi:MAG TPA: hypothetical protein VHQ65_05750 [Thermoanaerobaculia bacterium]|nr:hypothetical protein [Thermoanaerobaculia bacterium]